MTSLPVIRDGYTLSGTDTPNEFHFYRNDLGVIDDIPTSKVLELYQTYIMRRAQEGKESGILEKELSWVKSEDGRCVVVTVKDTP